MAAVAELLKPTATLGGGASPPMIAVDALAKHYGAVKAVDGISFTVARGEIVGKSTWRDFPAAR